MSHTIYNTHTHTHTHTHNMYPQTHLMFIIIHAPLASSLRRLFDVPNTEHEGDGDGGISENLDHCDGDGVDEEEEEEL